MNTTRARSGDNVRQLRADVPAIATRLARLAFTLDELVNPLEAVRLSDGDTLLLSAPLHHLTLGIARLGHLVYETERLDDRPRLDRLRAAA